MPRNEQFVDLRDFLGVNRRDGAEKADIREFLTIQNWYRKEKGTFAKCEGSTEDLSSSDVYGASKVTAMVRHTATPAPNACLYHCLPTSTPIAQPTGSGLVVTNVAAGDGTIFAAVTSASREVRFCYSYVGMGVESAWDTRLRSGYLTTEGLNAWDQPALQTLTLGSITDKVRASHPGAFPAGVRSVNVFMAVGSASDVEHTNLMYVGTLHSPSDSLLINASIGPATAVSDTFDDSRVEVSPAYDAAGSLVSGQYYVAFAWVAGGEPKSNIASNAFAAITRLNDGKPVQLSGIQNAIDAMYWETGGASTNGATHAYVFLGVKPPEEAPMTVVGIIRIGSLAGQTPFRITSFPQNVNASSYGKIFKGIPWQRDTAVGTRHAFIVKRDKTRTPEITEVLPARSAASLQTLGDDYDYQYLLIRSDSDRALNNTVVPANPNLVIPTLLYFNGLSYLVNGRDFLVTDGMSITRMVPKTGCVIPIAPVRLIALKSQLVATTVGEKGVLLASNALAANNWSEGGTGDAYRFAVLGDPFESGVTALSVFSYTTGIDGPRSFGISFKKNSMWSISQIADVSAGINGSADQMSGRVGTMAFRTIKNTKIGLIFLGSDGDVYMVRGNGEPYPIGGRVKKLLEHLVENDSLMDLCSAVVHGDFYKLFYPSSPESTAADAQLWADLRTQDGSPITWDGPHTGIEVSCQLVLDGPGDSGIRIAGLAGEPGTARLDDPSTYAHLGTPVVSILEWTRRNMRSEWNFKKWRGLFLEAYFSNLVDHDLLIEGFSDAEYTQVLKRVAVADENGEALWRSIVQFFPDDNLVGKDFRFRITHANPEAFTISAIGIPFKPERRLTI